MLFTHQENQFPIFVTKKKSGKYRMILNLKGILRWIPCGLLLDL